MRKNPPLAELLDSFSLGTVFMGLLSKLPAEKPLKISTGKLHREVAVIKGKWQDSFPELLKEALFNDIDHWSKDLEQIWGNFFICGFLDHLLSQGKLWVSGALKRTFNSKYASKFTPKQLSAIRRAAWLIAKKVRDGSLS